MDQSDEDPARNRFQTTTPFSSPASFRRFQAPPRRRSPKWTKCCLRTKSASIEKRSRNEDAGVRNRGMSRRFMRTLAAVYVVSTLVLVVAAAVSYVLGRAMLDSIVHLIGAIVLLVV